MNDVAGPAVPAPIGQLGTPAVPTAERLHAAYRLPVRHLIKMGALVAPDGVTEAQQAANLRARIAAMAEIWQRQARRSFPAFMAYCFTDERTGRGFQQQWFHDEWSAAWDAYDHVLICAPRDHGKTSSVVGRAIWELGRDPNLRIKIVCASDGRAKERLFEVVQHIESNPRVREVFPGLVPASHGEWSKHQIHVRRTALHRDASIEALGITSTATGGRADLLIADDAVDRRNALSYPALRKAIKQAWLSDWSNLLEPESRVWVICTLWHKDDLNHMLMGNPVYRVLQYQVGEDFGALWPEKWSTASLRRRHLEIGSAEFNRAFRNMVVDEDEAVVHGTWVRYADLDRTPAFVDRLDQLQFITSYDTASSPTGKADQDYSAGVCLAVDEEQRVVYVVDAWRARVTVAQAAKAVVGEYGQYRPFRIMIEKAGQAALDEWVLNEAPQLIGVIETVKPSVSKAARLLAVTPLLEQGRVIFGSHLNPDAGTWDPARGSLVHELLDFPFGKHDDLVDAFSQGLAAARKYFLDAWATSGENVLDVRIGTEGQEREYLY